ncbi:MAG: hypothetical protein HXY29_13995 [Rhodocyclaceae bacterium]|nr:hypothetical protein [Rhodocyclaceae bacterium]
MFWRLKAWYYGKKDGKIGLPQRDDPKQAPFEQRVHAAADNTIKKIHGKWESADSLMSARYQITKDTLRRAWDNYDKAINRLGRDTTVNSMAHYYIVLSIIGLAEAATTYVIFGLFGESSIITIIMTISIMIGLPLAGHFCGRFIKHGLKDKKEKILFFIVMCIAVSFLVAVAIIRNIYMTIAAQNGQERMISSTTATFTFITLNLTLFIASIIASYFAHDSDPHIYGLKRRYEKNHRRFQKIRANRESLRDKKKGESEAVVEAAKEIIAAYRDHNLRKRMKLGNMERPISFNNNPVIDIPSFEFETESNDHQNVRSEHKKIYKISDIVGEATKRDISNEKDALPF